MSKTTPPAGRSTGGAPQQPSETTGPNLDQTRSRRQSSPRSRGRARSQDSASGWHGDATVGTVVDHHRSYPEQIRELHNEVVLLEEQLHWKNQQFQEVVTRYEEVQRELEAQKQPMYRDPKPQLRRFAAQVKVEIDDIATATYQKYRGIRRSLKRSWERTSLFSSRRTRL